MRKSFQQIWVFLLTITFLTGCANLQYVSDFSQTAITGIEKYETLPHSFTENCLEQCRQTHIKNLDIHQVNCSCTNDIKADSITRILYATIRDYFYALSSISANELTQYRTADFTETLSTGSFGPVELDADDVEAYAKLSTVLLRAFSDGYRRKEIRKLIVQADGAVQTLLHYLDLNISGNLKGKLTVEKALAKNFYFDLINDKNLSVYERTKFAEDYFGKIDAISVKEAALTSYSAVIQDIAKGHAALKDNIDHLSDHEIKNLLGRYSVQLHKAIRSFNRNNE